MGISNIFKPLAATCLSVALVGGVTSCGSSPSGAVAATVNGASIPEEQVTDQIQNFRNQSGLSEDDQWGEYLVQSGMTPEGFRSSQIDTLVDQELAKQGAEKLGITVSDAEIKEVIEGYKANYSSDEAWSKALEQAGYTEDEYFESTRQSELDAKVRAHFEEEGEITDEDYVQAAQTYAMYYDGAKHVSKIEFAVEDPSDAASVEVAKSQAANVREQINAGALTFADAARQYSTDQESAADGGDIGWDKAQSFDSYVNAALTDLDPGQVSEPIESDGGVILVTVTEVYDAPEDITSITSVDQYPEGLRESVTEMAATMRSSVDYTGWLEDLRENAEITVNDMPEGLPYDIDLSPYEEENEQATGEPADISSEGAAPSSDADEKSPEDVAE